MKRDQAIEKEFWRLKSLELLPIMYMRLSYNNLKYVKEIKFMATKILEEMVVVAQKNHSKLNIIYTPIAQEANVMETKDFKYETFMFDFCKEQNIDCFSARPEFRAIKKESGHVFKEYGHWKEQGHRAIYNTVRRVMGENL